MAAFAVLKGLLMVVQSRELGARALPSEVYPAGKLSDIVYDYVL